MPNGWDLNTQILWATKDLSPNVCEELVQSGSETLSLKLAMFKIKRVISTSPPLEQDHLHLVALHGWCERQRVLEKTWVKAGVDSSPLQLQPAGEGGHTRLPRAGAGTISMVSKQDGACAMWKGLWDPKTTKRKYKLGFASRVAATWANVSLGRGACGASCGGGKVTGREQTLRGSYEAITERLCCSFSQHRSVRNDRPM